MPAAPPTRTDVPPSAPSADPVLDAVLRVIAHDGVKVPPIPAVVAKLSEHLANPSCQMRDVTQLVGTDQALSAHILRCASSTLLAARSQVTSLNEAVMRVGTNGLFSLSVSFHLGRDVTKASPLQSLRRDVFRRAAANAEFCRRLATRHGADPEGAFLCGLFGSFGLTVALGAIEQVVAATQVKQSRLAEAWMEIARNCQAQIGASVASQWGMPKLVAQVIAARASKEVDAALLPYVRLLNVAESLTDLFYREAAPSADEIANTIGCGKGEAAEIAAFLPEVAASVWALGVATDEVKLTQSIQIQMVETPASTLRGELVPASIPVTVERKGGDQQLVCVGLAADGFVAHGTAPLPLNQVVKCRMLGAEEDFEMVAYVAGVVKDAAEYRFEMKPMGLSGGNARKWQKLRHGSAKEFSANEGLELDAAGPSAEPGGDKAIEFGPMQSDGEPPPPPAGAPRQGGYVSLHAQKSPFRRLGSWLRGRGDA
jgi:HD-like signal output (HDOD) protein